MDGFQFLASVIASLAWPVVAIGAAYYFRAELKVMLKRPLRRGKLGPVEAEWESAPEVVAEELKKTVPAQPGLPAPEATAQAGVAEGKGQAHATHARAATDEILSIDDNVAVKILRGGSFTADAYIARIESSKSPAELADRVSEYVESRSAPALRELSAERIRLEQDLFGAVLQLQSRRAHGAVPADPARLATVLEAIRRFWTVPEGLSDDGVSDLAVLVRAVTTEMAGGS